MILRALVMLCSTSAISWTPVQKAVAVIGAASAGGRLASESHGLSRGRTCEPADEGVGPESVPGPATSRNECPDATITIDIKTDSYPGDITWELIRQGGGQVDAAGPLSFPFVLETWDVCVDSTGCFDFIIYDAWGNGICCGEGAGSYTVYYESAEVGSGGEFGDSETVANIGGGCQPSYCGDGTCDPDETSASCPVDCPPCEYCAACYTEQVSEWITNVEFNTIDNSTGQDGACSHGDYTSISTTVTRESTYTLWISFFSYGQSEEHLSVWIDWDQDCVFESNEDFYLGYGVDATLSKQITIPASAGFGCTRMRVIENYNVASTEPCPNLFYGEVEDYTVCVTDGTLGACCINAEPWCRDFLSAPDCTAQGGTFLGVGSACDLLDCNGNGHPDGCEIIGDGNFDADSDVDLVDYSALSECLAGPGISPDVPAPACLSAYLAAFDFDLDGDVDVRDFGRFQRSFGGTIP